MTIENRGRRRKINAKTPTLRREIAGLQIRGGCLGNNSQ